MVNLRPSWGSLALRALASAWAAVVAGWNSALAHTFWRVVFWWKKQTGWLDLGREISVTGTITAVDMNVTGLFNDGDVCFNVRLDSGWEWAITGFGGRRTSEDGKEPSIHCEIPPWTRSKFDGLWQQLAVGKRVAVTGSWGFDGVHVGAPEPVEVVLALFRHMPNVQDGWFELHPVTQPRVFAVSGCRHNCGSASKTTDGRCLPCRRALYRRVDWKRKGILFRGEPVTVEAYEAQLARQGGRCAICLIPLRSGVGRTSDSAALDHDHETIEFRGVLCLVCNKTLRRGLTAETLRRIIDYLAAPPAANG